MTTHDDLACCLLCPYAVRTHVHLSPLACMRLLYYFITMRSCVYRIAARIMCGFIIISVLAHSTRTPVQVITYIFRCIRRRPSPPPPMMTSTTPQIKIHRSFNAQWPLWSCAATTLTYRYNRCFDHILSCAVCDIYSNPFAFRMRSSV